jgi:hypothetical protein
VASGIVAPVLAAECGNHLFSVSDCRRARVQPTGVTLQSSAHSPRFAHADHTRTPPPTHTHTTTTMHHHIPPSGSRVVGMCLRCTIAGNASGCSTRRKSESARLNGKQIKHTLSPDHCKRCIVALHQPRKPPYWPRCSLRWTFPAHYLPPLATRARVHRAHVSNRHC